MASYELDLWEWERMAREAHYHAGEIATGCGLHPWQLRRRFRRSFGRPLREWLAELRLKDVERLMLTTDGRLKDAALSAGFHHNSSFTRWFKAHEGVAPSAFGPPPLLKSRWPQGEQGGGGI
jgi:AraC-like DNA-binding protein